MSYSSDRLYRQVIFTLTLVAFPIVLVIFAFSSCDLRRRSEKQACRDGAAEQCLAAGRFYEAKADGIIGFAMSNAVTAQTYYGLGCKQGSSVSCERLGHLMFHNFNSAKDDVYSYEDAVDAFALACVDNLTDACTELTGSFTDPRSASMAAARAARWFLDACNKAGKAGGCYQFAQFMTTAHGDTVADPALAKTYYAKACDQGHKEACAKSK